MHTKQPSLVCTLFSEHFYRSPNPFLKKFASSAIKLDKENQGDGGKGLKEKD